jgi:hypothetical protein
MLNFATMRFGGVRYRVWKLKNRLLRRRLVEAHIPPGFGPED